MNIKNEVLVRAYAVLILTLVGAIGIYTKAVRISLVEGEKWRSMGDSLYLDLRPVDAARGNILAADGSMLATSLPFFEIRMDLKSTGMSETDFRSNIDSLAWCLATFVDPSYSPAAMKARLIGQRAAGNRFLLLQRNASYEELARIKQFPLFRLGRYKGGLIAIQRSERRKPFGLLAHRTIGYVREGANPVGLEGYFHEQLAGEEGKQLMMRVGGDTWMPVNDLREIEPRNGDDVITTLDVNIQDIAEQALYRALERHEAQNGCAVVMEVATGAIKAIANLEKTEEGYWETYNFAVGAASEPGSTFKLASVMALLEDGMIRLSDSIDLEKGKTTFYEEEMKDASMHQIQTTSIKNAFEISSNVGIAKMIWEHYGENQQADRFVRRLRQFRLDQTVGIEIEGEVSPYIKEAYSSADFWSGTTLPWMSIGYEMTLTPLQLLTFYNAVANDGVMMQPYLVSAVQRFGEPKETFGPRVLKRRIASRRTIEKARELLEGVVENGTAQKIRSPHFKIAGKTGTAQINYQKLQSKTNVGGYQASFVGYFPADAPRYSCIVVVTNPKAHGFYGSEVAAPVFREIAEKLYASQKELHQPYDERPRPVLAGYQLPELSAGYAPEITRILDDIGMEYESKDAGYWTVLKGRSDTLQLLRRNVSPKSVPSVVGMGLRDALFVLENLGLKVRVKGYGKVKKQSLRVGTPIRGQEISLLLE